MPKKLIETSRVTVHYKCPCCKSKYQEPLEDITDTMFTCDECNDVENYMIIVGVSIKEPKLKQNAIRRQS